MLTKVPDTIRIIDDESFQITADEAWSTDVVCTRFKNGAWRFCREDELDVPGAGFLLSKTNTITLTLMIQAMMGYKGMITDPDNYKKFTEHDKRLREKLEWSEFGNAWKTIALIILVAVLVLF